jgi:hypothetical protein
MSESSDTVRLELILLARRIGIDLDERELSIVEPEYVGSREKLERLRELLSPDEEPAITFVRQLRGWRP